MAPALQARYPQICYYTGYGIGDAEHSKLKLDIRAWWIEVGRVILI